MNINAGQRSGKGTIAAIIEARYAVIISNVDKGYPIPEKERRVIEVKASSRYTVISGGLGIPRS